MDNILLKGSVNMDFDERFNQYLKKVSKVKDQVSDLTEEATKHALVMPFFSMLGYDVFDTNEFMPEFVCDLGTKKGEKIDYAILKDGEPLILIEAKRAGMKLQKQQYSQLYRYFTVNRCRIAILTNGIVYQMFSDINTPNIMDDEPFLSFNILEEDPSIYKSSIKQFCKDKFDIKNILSKAVFQKYEKVVIKTLEQDLISPSDEIVKYFLSRPEIKTGNRITSQMIEKHREITQNAMRKVFGTIIKEEKIIDNQQLSPQSSKPDIKEQVEEIVRKLGLDLQEENNEEFFRIHICNSDNRKIGVVKIFKSDNKIQFRKIGEGNYDIDKVDDIINFLEE